MLKNFEQRFGSSNYENIKHDDFKEFLDEFFAKEGDELVDCELLDWVKEPAKISAIKDPIYKAWALDLNEIWKKLCRKVWTVLLFRPSLSYEEVRTLNFIGLSLSWLCRRVFYRLL